MIRRPPTLLLSLALLMAPASLRAGEARFMTQPDVRGERIVFAYEGDLYLTGLQGGTPVRDNGRVEQSNNAFYGREGQWLVENHGADPDVLQDSDPASASLGRDAQLERAVAIALEKIKQKPWEFPARPAYPRR